MATQAASHATTNGHGVAAPRRGFQEELDALVDQVSDIGKQIWFMVTGELREFTSLPRVHGQ